MQTAIVLCPGEFMSEQTRRVAQFWQDVDGSVSCSLCHQNCRIRPGLRGLCGVRENQNKTLMTLVYGNLVAANVDPIEKRPFFHFLPGTLAYSIATVGCNFRCLHCQNADIAQIPKDLIRIPGDFVSPEEVVATAVAYGCRSIAYTYSEPTIFFEYAYDVAVLAKKNGLKNVFVSNGYTGEEAVETIIPFLDANNIDLKGDDDFYRKVCGARVEPVKQNIELFHKKGVWVEVTTLVIPGYNDSAEQLKGIAEFLAGVSPDMPWHISAFYPMHKLTSVPRTSVQTLLRARDIGLEAGLKHVYLGNIPGEGENTLCPVCGQVQIERLGYRVMRNSIIDGHCSKCGSVISGVWS
jgi:pyruvate formate lyase activating enzyme